MTQEKWDLRFLLSIAHDKNDWKVVPLDKYINTM